MKRLIACLILALLLFSGCSENGMPKENGSSGNLTLHEWGVLGGCAGNDSFVVTSRPKRLVYADLPVIYVHSEDTDTINLSVSFANGEPTDTYPNASVAGNTVSWDKVKVEPSKKEPQAEMDSLNRVPLEEILPALNDVDADELGYNGKTNRFLFYEGRMQYNNRVNVSVDQEDRVARFKNNADYQVYNVIAAIQIGDYMNSTTLVAHVDSLDPGQEVSASLKERSNPESLIREDMRGLGFTKKETDAFLETWRDPFFFPTNMGFSNLIYRLPQEKYDEMLPAHVEPQPKEYIRSMYALVEF